MNSKEWWEETRELMNHINANPVITATYPCLEPVVGYLRDLCFDLAACEAERDDLRRKLEEVEDYKAYYETMETPGANPVQYLAIRDLRERIDARRQQHGKAK